MTTRAQKIRLGTFMLLAFLLLFGSIATLAGMKLWNPKDRYYARFRDSISGLEVGSTVKMKGVRVGQVEQISISRDVESVIVTLSLEPGTPISKDTRAIMMSIGITGLKFVELTGGSALSKPVLPNTKHSIIRAGSSTLETLTGKATDIALKMEGVLNNLLNLTEEGNRLRFRRLLEDVDKLAVTYEGLASGNGSQIKRIIENVEKTSLMMEKAASSFAQLTQENAAAVRDVISSSASAAKSIERMVQGMHPEETLKAITEAAGALRRRIDDPSITHALGSLNGASKQVSHLTHELEAVVRQRDRQIGLIMNNLDKASDYLKDFARSIKEKPSLLLRGETRKDRPVP
jgi:phospholipid/cholesterol/gamma-HCH transport system substrate-binding protein